MCARFAARTLCLATLWLITATAALAQGAGQPDASALLAQGNQQFAQQQYAQAVETFTQVIQLAPQDSVAYNSRGTAYFYLGKKDLALDDFTMAIKLDPRNAHAYTNRGTLYVEQGNDDLAIVDFTAALQLEPDDVLSYFGRAKAYQHVGETALGMADQEKAIAIGIYGKNPPLINQASFTGTEKACVVDFELEMGLIFVNVRLGEEKKPYCFLFDSGFGTVAISESLAHRFHAKLGDEVDATDAFGTRQKCRLCVLDSLALGACRLRNPLCVILDLQPLREITGRQIDGIIGVSFLCNYRVTIDYPRHQLTFAQTADALSGTYLLKAVKPQPFAALSFPISIDGQTLPVVLDTGCNYTGLPISLLQKLNYPPEEQLGSLGSTTGGIYGESGNSAMLLRINDLRIGDLHLQHYPLSAIWSEQGILGEDLLSQFLVTLDYPGNAVALTPVSHATFNTNFFTTGFCALHAEKNGLRIGGIWKNSPAAKAGILPGDLILQINGKPALATDDVLFDETITSCNLLVESNGVQRHILLNKAYLFPPVSPN